MLASVIQFVFALVVVLALFFIAFSIYNYEFVKATIEAKKIRKRTDIFSGIKDGYYSKNEEYDTRERTLAMYREISPSFNQRGGAEFSYNFWLWKDDSKLYPSMPYRDMGSLSQGGESDPNSVDSGLSVDQIILLMKGIKAASEYPNVCGNRLFHDGESRTIKKFDVMVKCPLIKLERMGNYLTVEVNTIQAPDPVREAARYTCSETSISWSNMNRWKVAVGGLRTNPKFSNNWFMVTVVVQDTMADDPIPIRNKVRVCVYINGVMELDRYLDGVIGVEGQSNPTVLKQNNGNLYVLPHVQFKTKQTHNIPEAEALMMADLSYFNYALGVEEIKALVNRGFTKSSTDGNSVRVEKEALFTMVPLSKTTQLTAF